MRYDEPGGWTSISYGDGLLLGRESKTGIDPKPKLAASADRIDCYWIFPAQSRERVTMYRNSLASS